MALQFNKTAIDFGAFGRPIAAAVNKMVEYKMKEDQIFNTHMQEMRRGFSTNKMRPGDIAKFYDAFEGYVSAQKTADKMNKGGGNSQQVLASNELTKNAYVNMTNVYEKSANLHTTLKSYDDFGKSITSKGHVLPIEFKTTMWNLGNKPLDEIDLDKVPNPMDFQYMASTDDLKNFDDVLHKSVKFSPVEKDVIGDDGKPKMFTVDMPSVNGKPGKSYQIKQRALVNAVDPNEIINFTNGSFVVDEPVHNTAILMKNKLVQALNLDPSDAKNQEALKQATSEFGKIKAIADSMVDATTGQKLYNIRTASDIPEALVYGFKRNHFAETTKSYKWDDKEFATVINAVRADFGMDLQSANLAAQGYRMQNQLNQQANSQNMDLLRIITGGAGEYAPGLLNLLGGNLSGIVDPDAYKKFIESKKKTTSPFAAYLKSKLEGNKKK